jgi:DNA-binding transcriptional LysR family regulator
MASAIEGHGLTRLYSYHVAEAVKAGQLKVVLPDAEFPALPIHLLTPHGRAAVPKVRAFLDFAAPRLRETFGSLADDARALG